MIGKMTVGVPFTDGWWWSVDLFVDGVNFSTIGMCTSADEVAQQGGMICARWNASALALESMEAALAAGHGLAHAVPALRILRAAVNGEGTMIDLARLVLVNDQQSREEADAATSMSGQGDLMRALEKDPLALAEKRSIPKRGYDHAFLARYKGTDVVQWQARSSNGRFYPFGSMMRIVWGGDNG